MIACVESVQGGVGRARACGIAGLLAVASAAMAVGQEVDPCAEGDRVSVFFQERNVRQTPALWAALPPWAEGGERSRIALEPGERELYVGVASELSGGGLQGWSLCFDVRGDYELLDATTDGTMAARSTDDPPGLFEDGFSDTRFISPGGGDGTQRPVISGVLLSFWEPVPTLEPVGTATVLRVTIAGEDGQGGELLWFHEKPVGEGGGGTSPFQSTASADGELVHFCREVDAEVVFHPEPFRRGDANADGRYDISDAVHVLAHLFDFAHPVELTCRRAGDSNDDGAVDISDAIFSLNGLFGGGGAPPPPFGECGTDSTPDALGCESYEGC